MEISSLSDAVRDHEMRIRSTEKDLGMIRQDILTGLMELKGEFAVIKTRLTSIEKAVKP